MAVLASAYANGGDENNSQPGLDYFKNLIDSGQIRNSSPNSSNIKNGECPISLIWDFEGLQLKESLGMNLITIIPSDGTIAGLFIQFITNSSPHPSAARLMYELEFSDKGQLLFVNSFLHPIRDSIVIPADILSKFPPKDSYNSMVFPKDINALIDSANKISESWNLLIK
jgi:putative spermidine/putrescine transport system substrate-binding protein